MKKHFDEGYDSFENPYEEIRQHLDGQQREMQWSRPAGAGTREGMSGESDDIATVAGGRRTTTLPGQQQQ